MQQANELWLCERNLLVQDLPRSGRGGELAQKPDAGVRRAISRASAECAVCMCSRAQGSRESGLQSFYSTGQRTLSMMSWMAFAVASGSSRRKTSSSSDRCGCRVESGGVGAGVLASTLESKDSVASESPWSWSRPRSMVEARESVEPELSDGTGLDMASASAPSCMMDCHSRCRISRDCQMSA